LQHFDPSAQHFCTPAQQPWFSAQHFFADSQQPSFVSAEQQADSSAQQANFIVQQLATVVTAFVGAQQVFASAERAEPFVEDC
jgi:hypothetical protein